MNDEQLYNLIEKYLDGSLGLEEKLNFEKQIESDPELAREVELHRDLASTLVDSGELELSKTVREIMNEGKKPTDKQNEYRFRTYLLLIIMAVIALVAIWYLTRQEDKPAVIEYYATYQDFDKDISVYEFSKNRTATDSTDTVSNLESEWTEFQSYYNAGNLKKARDKLAEIRFIEANEPMWQFYNGLLLVKNDHFEEAKEAFILSRPYDSMSVWYEALVNLKLGNLDEVRSLLLSISNRRHARSDQIKNLLEELNSLN